MMCLFKRFFVGAIFLLLCLSNLQASDFVAGDIPDYGEKYLSPSAIKSTVNAELILACRTSNEMLVIKDDKVINTIALLGTPSGLAISEDSKLAYVSIAIAKGKIQVVDIQSAKVIKNIEAGHYPIAPQIKDNVLYYLEQFSNKINAYDLNTSKLIATNKPIREPIAQAISSDKIFVANALPESAGGLYVEEVGACISVFKTNTLEKLPKIQLPYGSINVQDIIISPDNKYAICTHVIARFNAPATQLDRGWLNTNVISIIDIEKNELYASVPLDDVDMGSANPYSLLFVEGGKTLVVSQAGTHELSVIDYEGLLQKIEGGYNSINKQEGKKVQPVFTKGDSIYAKISDKTQAFSKIANDLEFLKGIRKRILLDGFAPRFLTQLGDKVYVSMYYSDTLNILNLSDLGVKKLSIGGNEKLNQIRLGDLNFHDGSLCFQKWLSCVTCHPEVRVDGLNWDLRNDGIGNPKQTKSMLFTHFTPPSTITGARKNAELSVIKGIKHIQFADRPKSDAYAIDEYLKSLKPVESPYLVDGKLSESAERGGVIFEIANCGQCHSGKYYTDKKMHNVGTGLNEYENREFDTPTLAEVWRTAPYLYDGRAKTIYEMFKKFNKDDKHGKTSDLSEEDLQDLQEYVLSL